MNKCPNTDTFLLCLIHGAWMQCDSFRFGTEVRSCWQLYLVLLSIWIAIARATPQGNSFNKIFSFRKGNAKAWLEYVIVLLSKRIYCYGIVHEVYFPLYEGQMNRKSERCIERAGESEWKNIRKFIIYSRAIAWMKSQIDSLCKCQ